MPKKRNRADNFLSIVDNVILLHPLLKKISDGEFFTLIFSWLVRFMAFISVIVFLYGSWKMWSSISGASGEVFLAALLTEILMAGAIYVIFNILWVRAYNIQNLPLSRDYAVTPIVTILIKASGEISATMLMVFGLAVSITSWIGGSRMQSIIPISLPIPGNTGAVALVSGIVAGFFSLALAYFTAETIGALVDIARNTKRIK